MTEKKRPIKPGQENLDPNLYGPKDNPTYTSGGELGTPPSTLSRRTSSTTSSTVVWKVTSVKLPATVLFQAKKRCLELGLYLQDVLTALLEQWLGTEILTPEQRKNPPKKSLRTEIGDLQIKRQLHIIEGARKRGAKPEVIEEFQNGLARVAKKAKISPEMEAQVRKELNL